MLIGEEVKLCTNCEHYRRKAFSAGCNLGKWRKTFKNGVFFYSPDKIYWDDNNYSNRFIWNNGVFCKEYDGNTFILTEISTPDTICTAIQYNMIIKEIEKTNGLMFPKEILVTIEPEKNDNLSQWLGGSMT